MIGAEVLTRWEHPALGKTDFMNFEYTNKNEKVREFFTEHFLENINHHPWLAPESAAAHKKAYEEAMQKKMTGFVDFMGRFEGSIFHYYRSYYSSVPNAEGRIYHIVGRADKIDDDVNFVKNLTKKAEHDALTGLLNYESLLRNVETNIELFRCGAFLMMDIDNFKDVNDTYGHLTGNRMLKAVAEVLTEAFRQSDVLARFGGDEFTIFLPSVTDDTWLCKKGADLVNKIHAIEVTEGVHLSASIGGVIVNDTSVSVEQMLKQAD